MDSATIFFIIVLLHVVVGFGYLMYKMSGKKKVDEEE